MKELTMFYLEGCPYCRRAFAYMDELKKENPVYETVPIRLVEERKERELAESYDYFYVPTYYLGDEKLVEGVLEKDDVKGVFERALKG